MLKKPSLLGKEAGKYLLIATMTGMLVGCGGSSGDAETPIGEQDADLDGIPDSEDNFIDLDGDGRDDYTLQTEAEANGVTVVEVSADNPCGGESGIDNNSANDPWNDNCLVKNEGQFANSFFAAGIQRVLYCSGFAEPEDYADGKDYTDFADGIFGPRSEAATIAFQEAANPKITVDGVVGPQTWARLQASVELLIKGNFTDTPDSYGFKTEFCPEPAIPMFYQETSPTVDNDDILKGGWKLARNAPVEAQTAPFSYEKAFGNLD